ncbi:MAG: response regulator [Myxococcaceae bacterium]|nr:response regulator [Myxococcaceae bacterium]
MKILVVDDDLDLCAMLSRFFEKHGFIVHSAGDALQALDILAREPIDFVIADLMMPHMDGITFLETLKQDSRYAHLPVVLLTAYPSEEILDKGMRKGAAFALPKPVDFERLLNLVRFAQ